MQMYGRFERFALALFGLVIEWPLLVTILVDAQMRKTQIVLGGFN